MNEETLNEEIFAKVQNIVVEHLDVKKEQVTPDATFAHDLGADSLDTVELVMALEEAFDIEIPDEAAGEIDTVRKAVSHIEKKQTASA